MANALIGYRNRIDAAVLSSGSWSASLPLANLQSTIIGKVARSSSPLNSATKFDMDLGAARAIRIVGLAGHNLSLAANYRIRGATDAGFASVVSDSGWLAAWPSGFDPEAVAEFSWTLSYSLSVSVSARYWRIEIDDTTNSAGYVEIGRAFIGDAWQPTTNMSVGASIGWEETTAIQTALSGAEYFSHVPVFRVARFSTTNMPEAQALGMASEIQRISGVSGEVFFMWDPDDTAYAPQLGFLGRLRTLSAIEAPRYAAWDGAWEIKERL